MAEFGIRSFLGLREDKAATKVRREMPASVRLQRFARGWKAVTLTNDALDSLQRLATAENRSLSGTVRWLIHREWQRRAVTA